MNDNDNNDNNDNAIAEEFRDAARLGKLAAEYVTAKSQYLSAEGYAERSAAAQALQRIAQLVTEEPQADTTQTDLDRIQTTLSNLSKPDKVQKELDRIGSEIADLLNFAPAELDVLTAFRDKPEPVDWLVRDWIPAATVTTMTGGGGAGKSRIAMQLAVAVSLGLDHFILPHAAAPPLVSHAPKVNHGGGGSVVFAAWETRRLATENRLLSVCQTGIGSDIKPSDLDGRLHSVNMRSIGPLWGARQGQHAATVGELLPGGSALLEYARDVDARLLIIDPVAAAYGGSENDRSQVRRFLSLLDEFAETANCSVLLISHPPKSVESYSGSTDWRNGVQSMIVLDQPNEEEESRIMRVDKLNESRIPKPVRVKWDSGRFSEYHYGGSDNEKSKV